MNTRVVLVACLLVACVSCTGRIQPSPESQTKVVWLKNEATATDHKDARIFNRINQTEDGIAIHGYDPVAYFTDGKPTLGRSAFEATWMGATWRFATAEHRERFVANPETYAPQYGGYCSLGISENIIANGSPLAWKIVEDKLYFNYNRFYHVLWTILPNRIARADRHWPALQGERRASPVVGAARAR